MAIRVEEFSAGRWEKGTGFKYFVPSEVNDQWTWEDPALNALLEQASIKLGELNAYAKLVPNIDQFIHLHVTKEAVVSSRIEGTQTKIDEALLPESEIRPARRHDWQEVKNYTRALNTAIEEMESLPLSSRLLRNTHRILLEGVRGENKLPGQFRNSQNWIGGNSLADATFIPPAHHYLPELMSDLEMFLHNQDAKVPALVKIGIAHYQFETIHPFLDGNGRIGRLLVPLYLIHERILTKPLLYLSSYFEKDRGLYYDNLMYVRTGNRMLQWLKYFLVGIAQSSAEGTHTLSRIVGMKAQIENQIRSHWGRRIDSALNLIEYLFEQPVVRIRDVANTCNLSFKAANHLVESFEKAQILKETTGQGRNRIFKFESYLNLFE